MANLTLAIDNALLQRVHDFLRRYVDARSRRLEALERFETVASPSHSRSSVRWSREELHNRS